jgi:hypothetical protein
MAYDNFERSDDLRRGLTQQHLQQAIRQVRQGLGRCVECGLTATVPADICGRHRGLCARHADHFRLMSHAERMQALIDMTPPRPNELKTADDFAREYRADQISRTALKVELNVDDETFKLLGSKYAMPAPIRFVRGEPIYSRTQIAVWRNEFLSVVAMVGRR